MFDGKKVGTGLLSENGTLTMSISDTSIAEKLKPSGIQHFSIVPTLKE